MPLQNRVTPFGDIVAVTLRGLFTGNRGILHDPATKALLPLALSYDAGVLAAVYRRSHALSFPSRRSESPRFQPPQCVNEKFKPLVSRISFCLAPAGGLVT